MPNIYALLLIAGIYLMVLASPGPNFFILSQMALDGRAKEARYVVLGLTTGSIVWVVVALAGIATLLSQHPWLASALQTIGAAYLIWYGIRLFHSAVKPVNKQHGDAKKIIKYYTKTSAYRTGLLTGVTNPKGAAFWTSAFATMFPSNPPSWFYLATFVMVISLSLGWHMAITFVFSTPTLRNAYIRIERAVNGLAGGVLITLGIHRIVVR